MIIEECKTEEQFEAMMNLAKKHPEPEYDCSFEEYKELLRGVILKPLFRAWIAYEDGTPIGYISATRSYIPRNQISLHDIFLDNKKWGSHVTVCLIQKVIEWMKEDKALRIMWTSKISLAGWKRFLRINGLDLNLDSQTLLIWEGN